MHFETVYYNDPEEALDTCCDVTCGVCSFLSYYGLPFFPVWLIYKLGRATDPNRLQLSHCGGKQDDPRGEQNMVIIAPPQHTSV